jgi:hypothetical protein
LDQARARSRRLRQRLADRGVHPRILAACAPEIADENFFHTVLEAEEPRRRNSRKDRSRWRRCRAGRPGVHARSARVSPPRLQRLADTNGLVGAEGRNRDAPWHFSCLSQPDST